MRRILLCIVVSVLQVFGMEAQPITEKYERFLTSPRHYVCRRTAEKINVDGVLKEKSWQYAKPVGAFVDISGEDYPKPCYSTTAKMLWDDEYLYIAAVLEDPHVWADIKKRDEVVYRNNDFEIFIDPDGDGHNYFEIEVNAIGTVFDLALEKPYRAPTPAFVQFQWNCPGLKVATKVDGTLNKPTDVDKGWTVEMAIPRKAIAQSFHNYLQAGTYLRIGLSRVQWQYDVVDGKYQRKKDAKGTYLAENNWTWGATGKIDMHMPERWGYVYLSDKVADAMSADDDFVLPADAEVERLLWAMFYEQEHFFATTGRYHCSVQDFHLTDDEWSMLPAGATLAVEATSHNYEMFVTMPDGSWIGINADGQLHHHKLLN